MSEDFDPADFSFVVKRRGGPLKPWVWEIYRAGRSGPVKRSAVFFETMAEATKEGKKSPCCLPGKMGCLTIDGAEIEPTGRAPLHIPSAWRLRN